MNKLLLTLLLLCTFIVNARAGDFTLSAKNGSFTVMFNGKELISSSNFYIDGQPIFRPGELLAEKQTLKDGSTAFNIISKDPARRFRQEGVISADGSKVELNMQFEYQAYSPAAGKAINYTLALPFERFKNLPFAAIHGRNMRPKNQKGIISPALQGNLTDGKARMLTVKMPEGDLLFDFSPAGVCNFSGGTGNTCIGMWQVARLKNSPNSLSFNAGYNVPLWGGGLASKLIITRGDSKSYRTRHPRVKYSYYDSMPAQRLYSFGAEKVGKRYTKLDLTAQGTSAYWLKPGNAKKLTGKHPGAFYSTVAGNKPALLKVKNLQPGYYFITAGIGNFEGKSNKSTIKVNGILLEKDITVKPQQAASITKVFKLENGSADIEFSGNWQISTLGFQLLTNFYEDYTFHRGFWVTDALEPLVMYKNVHYATEPKFVAGRTDVVMPDPSKAAKPVKSLVYSVKQPSAEAQKNMTWRYTARVTQLGPNNNGTFNEFNAPGLVERRLKELAQQKFNTVIVSGLLSRHTYPRHLDRVRTMLKRMAENAHKYNLKIYDHIDYTLLWNMDSGFRVASENPQWLTRELDTLLPSTDFCVNNHDRNQAFRKYLKEYIKDTGLDGMMIDEVCFVGNNFCGCGDCRNDFTSDTDQMWPLNELAKDQISAQSTAANTPLAKTFRAWRRKRVGDWWVELRKSLAKDFPQFGFLCYSTHYGLTSNHATNSLGADLVQIARAVDFIGTEIMPRNIWANYRPIFAYRKAQNMLRNAFGLPIYGQIYAPGGWDVAYFGWGIMNMNSQVYWAEPAMKCPPGKSNYYAFADRNMDIGKAENCADVVLLFSSQGRDNGLMMNYKNELFGMAQTLGDMHVNYDIICDTMLSAAALEKYKVLFVGTSAPLSDKQIAIIRKFAADGGHVILGPIAALADEYGNMRKKWPFEELFKFHPSNKLSKVKMLALDNGATVQPTQIITAYLPHPRNMKMPSAPVNMVWGKTRIPAIFSKNYGKGKIKFMPLCIGSNLRQEELMVGLKVNFELDKATSTACKHLWKSILKDAQAGTWECNAPEKVPATLYKHGGYYYAHFLNATGVNLKVGDVIQFAIPDNAFPALKEDITFTLPGKKLTTAEAASPDFDGWKQLKVSVKDNSTTVTLPKELLKVYTLVRIK